MQTLHRLRRFRDLRAVSPGARPPADGVPSPALVAPDQEARPAFPNPSWPTFAVGLRPAVPVRARVETTDRRGLLQPHQNRSARAGTGVNETRKLSEFRGVSQCRIPPTVQMPVARRLGLFDKDSASSKTQAEIATSFGIGRANASSILRVPEVVHLGRTPMFC